MIPEKSKIKGQQGQQKLSSLKYLKIKNPPTGLLLPPKKASLLNCRMQNRKERPKGSTNNGIRE